MDNLKNINLVRKVAWSFHNTTGIDFEELFDVALMNYVEYVQKTYDENKGKFSYWAYRNMEQTLINYCKGKQRQPKTQDINENDAVFEFHEKFEDLLNEMPSDCKLISRLILLCPEDLANYPPKIARGKVVKLLREEGWTWERIWGGMKEMKLYLAYN